jgi:hypothetical protein
MSRKSPKPKRAKGRPAKGSSRRPLRKRVTQKKKRSHSSRQNKNNLKRRQARRKTPVRPKRRQRISDPRIARALGQMRREGVSASTAANREKMKLNTFRKGAGRFLYRSGPGKPWKARDDDQLSFSMEVLTRQGRISVIIRNSSERRLLHDYEKALRMFRGAEDGAEDELKKFEGKTVGGYELITDIKVLIELEEAAELDFESLYSPVGGKS